MRARHSDVPLLDEPPGLMFGQLCERPPDPPGGTCLPGPGAVVLVRGGVVDDVVVPLPVEVVEVDVAALASAAPPPAIAAMAAIVTSRGLNLRIWSPPFVGPEPDVPRPPSEPGRRPIRVR
jgi:hypothetical protein